MRIAVLIVYTVAAAVAAVCAAGLLVTYAGLVGQAERELYGPGEPDQAQLDMDDNDW